MQAKEILGILLCLSNPLAGRGGDFCPDAKAHIFLTRLEKSKPGASPFSAPLGTGITGMHVKSSLLHGGWGSNSGSKDCTLIPMNHLSSSVHLFLKKGSNADRGFSSAREPPYVAATAAGGKQWDLLSGQTSSWTQRSL